MKDKCTKCHGSGWYEPKNMGGMIVEPCNRCDAGKAIQSPHKAEKPKTYDKCPVCGCVDLLAFNECPCHKGTTGLSCGYGVDGVGCENSERLAIARAAEIERLRAQLKAMADFFSEYTYLSECEQSHVDGEAERLIASARKTSEAKQ